jgi:hypothetical protein
VTRRSGYGREKGKTGIETRINMEYNLLMDNLFSNEWVTGIGVSVIAGIILIFLKRFFKKNKKNNGKNINNYKSKDSSYIEPGGSISARDIVINNNANARSKTFINKTIISPSDIKRKLDSVNPYRKGSLANDYKGIKVKWSLELREMSKTKNGNMRVYTSSNGQVSPFVVFEINPKKHPEFKFMDRGDSFLIEGTIEKISNDIYLREVLLIN